MRKFDALKLNWHNDHRRIGDGGAEAAKRVQDAWKQFHKQSSENEYLRRIEQDVQSYTPRYTRCLPEERPSSSPLQSLMDRFRESMRDIVREEIDEKAGPIEPLLQGLAEMSLPDTFHELLERFGAVVAETFWKCMGEPDTDDPKLPEKLAQLFVNAYLRGKYDKVGYTSIETAAGNGYVDTRVHFLNRTYLVELKVLDSKRSIGWVKEGLTQLDQYMEAYNCHESYLLVFDCRATDRGEKLEPLIHRSDNRTIHVIWQRMIWPKSSRRSQ